MSRQTEPVERRMLLSAVVQRISDLDRYPTYSASSEIKLVGGHGLFSASSAESGNELWRTDGTANGTVLVKDLRLQS